MEESRWCYAHNSYDRRPTYSELLNQGIKHRGLKDLSLPELGRVNLITGKNNTGKSSVLEALRIFTQNAAPSTIYNILQYREEVTRRGREEERTDDPDDLFQISYLFHGFPRLSEEPEPIEFFVGSKTSPMFLNMSIDWLTMEHGPEGNRLARSGETRNPFSQRLKV